MRIGWLRSVHTHHFAFATASFIDEIAQARGDDPRDVLLGSQARRAIVTPAELGVAQRAQLWRLARSHPIDSPSRLRRVVESVPRALPRGTSAQSADRAPGLAAHRSFLTYTAAVVSVVQLPSGKVHVDEAWIVADAGKVVNPERARSQMEGAVVFGMSIALHGAITFKKGAVEQTNFRDYKLTRIGESPKAIHVEGCVQRATRALAASASRACRRSRPRSRTRSSRPPANARARLLSAAGLASIARRGWRTVAHANRPGNPG